MPENQHEYWDSVSDQFVKLTEGWSITRSGVMAPDGTWFVVTGPSGRWTFRGAGPRYYKSLAAAVVAAGTETLKEVTDA